MITLSELPKWLDLLVIFAVITVVPSAQWWLMLFVTEEIVPRLPEKVSFLIWGDGALALGQQTFLSCCTY